MINTDAAIAAVESRPERVVSTAPLMVAYICENAGRPGAVPSSGIRRRPVLPNFAWPLRVLEVPIPCAGRLQPEHVLKALEDGADAVGVICCEEDNCHHHEGSRRCRRRLDYVGKLIEEIGLGSERLIIAHLPGSAAQDMALGAGMTPSQDVAMDQRIATVREFVLERLSTTTRNPMAKGEMPDESPYEVDSQDESDD
jgi:heterodisulfide reductase subunit A2